MQLGVSQVVKAPVFEIGMRGFEPHTPCQNIAVRVGSPGTARIPKRRFDSVESGIAGSIPDAAARMSMLIAE